MFVDGRQPSSRGQSTISPEAISFHIEAPPSLNNNIRGAADSQLLYIVGWDCRSFKIFACGYRKLVKFLSEEFVGED
jgi:hypothetical protein